MGWPGNGAYLYPLSNGESLEPIRKQMRDMAANPYEEYARVMPITRSWMIYPKSYRIEGVEEEKEMTLNYNCVDPNLPILSMRNGGGRFFKTGEPYVMVS